MGSSKTAFKGRFGKGRSKKDKDRDDGPFYPYQDGHENGQNVIKMAIMSEF
jgi:hypothetical protein